MLEEKISVYVARLEDENNLQKKKILEYEQLMQTQKDIITNIKGKFKMERLKTTLYLNVLNSHGININDTIEETDECLNVYKTENTNLSVIVHDFFKNKKEQVQSTEEIKQHYSISIKSRKKHNQKTYRTIKNKDKELKDEKPEIQEEKIKKVEDDFENIVNKNFDISYNQTLENIDNIFNELSSGRICKKSSFLSIKEQRNLLIGKISLTEYIIMLKKHNKKLNDILIKKDYEHKKINLNISYSLTPLEQRLLNFYNYFSTEIDTDEMQRFQLVLKINTPYSRRYIPFVYGDFFEYIYNYGMAVFPIKENLKRVLVNPYGFSNIVYVNNEKSLKDDPYSFYCLEKIDEDGRRLWKMECRLYEFTKFISQNLLTYTINIFKKIYMDIFLDNIYRKDYKDKAVICRQDCEQLLFNIIELSNTKTLCETIRKIVLKNCMIEPTKLDKFDFTADDRLIKKQLNSDNDTKEQSIHSVKRLFDNISKEDCEFIINSLTE